MTSACVLSVIFSGRLTSTYAEFLFLIAAPLCFVVSYKIDNESMKLLAGAVVALWVQSLIFTPKGSGLGFSLLETSGMATESTYCFPLAVITLYFLLSKQYRWGLVMAFVTILAFKRSAILGIFLALGAYMIVSRFNLGRSRQTALWISFSVFIVGGIMALSLVTLFEAVEYTGSINALTAGRYNVNKLLLMLFEQSPAINFLFGHGWGYTTDTIASLTRWGQPHNDFFRVMLDQGVIGFSLIMAGWVLVLRSGVYTVPLAVLMATFLPFDNTLIYLHSSLIFVFVANALRQLDEQAGTRVSSSPFVVEDRNAVAAGSR